MDVFFGSCGFCFKSLSQNSALTFRLMFGIYAHAMDKYIYKLGICFLTFLALAFLHPFPAFASAGEKSAEKEQCFKYETTVITLTGTIKKEVHPGTPNYESIANGDEALVYWFLYLDKPVCVSATIVNGEVEDDEERNIRKVQIVPMEDHLYDKAKEKVNKKVAITGTLFHQIFSRHYTKVLISVKSSADIKIAR